VYLTYLIHLTSHAKGIYFFCSRYRSSQIRCLLPDNRNPAYVSIVNDKTAWTETLNIIEVAYVVTSQPRHKFSMCLSPIFGTPSTLQDLIQYFELNRILGAETFLVYNYSLSLTAHNSVLQYYTDKGLVSVIQWKLPPVVAAHVWYNAQMLMLLDCMYRNKGHTKYLINTDIDEFIVPVKHPSWEAFLKTQDSACEYRVRSVSMKGKPCPKDPENKQICVKSLAMQTRSTFIFLDKIRSKCITEVNCQELPGIHFTRRFRVSSGSSNKPVNTSDALLYHYSKFPQDHEYVPDTRMNAYATILLSNIRTVLDNLSDKDT